MSSETYLAMFRGVLSILFYFKSFLERRVDIKRTMRAEIFSALAFLGKN
jgi:hypothetical protein